jgi:hypothetical protein
MAKPAPKATTSRQIGKRADLTWQDSDDEAEPKAKPEVDLTVPRATASRQSRVTNTRTAPPETGNRATLDLANRGALDLTWHDHKTRKTLSIDSDDEDKPEPAAPKATTSRQPVPSQSPRHQQLEDLWI